MELEVFRVFCSTCQAVKQERLSWLADNPFYTRRFAFYVGRRCRSSSVKAIAKELDLDWRAVKALDTQYMEEQLRRVGTPGPRVLGIDEIHLGALGYRIVVTDLERRRAIWVGGIDRSEKSMDHFYAWLGPKKSSKIRLIVMDMWAAYQASARRHAPQAKILFDKFHVMKGLGEALDEVRKSEYQRLTGQQRKFIKGQKYALLSHPEALTTQGRRALKKLLAANKRLNTAYLLKESFGQLWEYTKPAWARKFFENWQASLKWQRLEPYRRFARTVESHWAGIEVYCDPKNHVPLGFVESFNNLIRHLLSKAFGYRDEHYFRLKILTCMLKEI